MQQKPCVLKNSNMSFSSVIAKLRMYRESSVSRGTFTLATEAGSVISPALAINSNKSPERKETTSGENSSNWRAKLAMKQRSANFKPSSEAATSVNCVNGKLRQTAAKLCMLQDS